MTPMPILETDKLNLSVSIAGQTPQKSYRSPAARSRKAGRKAIALSSGLPCHRPTLPCPGLGRDGGMVVLPFRVSSLGTGSSNSPHTPCSISLTLSGALSVLLGTQRRDRHAEQPGTQATTHSLPALASLLGYLSGLWAPSARPGCLIYHNHCVFPALPHTKGQAHFS